MSQTVVSEQRAGFEGQLVDLGSTDIQSYANGDSVNIQHGSYVVLSSTDGDEAKLPAAGTDITNIKKNAGVVLREHTVENAQGGSPVGVEQPDDTMSVLNKGRVFVKMNGSFNTDTVVHVGFQNGDEGRFFSANSADREALPKARLKNSGADGDLAILDLAQL